MWFENRIINLQLLYGWSVSEVMEPVQPMMQLQLQPLGFCQKSSERDGHCHCIMNQMALHNPNTQHLILAIPFVYINIFIGFINNLFLHLVK